MRFIYGKALDEREILVLVGRAPDVAENLRKVTESIASLSHEAWSVWIKEHRAVKEVVCRLRQERAIWLFVATTRLARKGIVRIMVRSKQRHAGNTAQPGVRRAELRVFCIAGEGDERRAALVTHNTSHLPATQHLVNDAALV